MSTHPLVSITIPFLNAERFIEETIASVLAQTYGAWELLLVDDGSSDASTGIAQRYAKQYPEKVRYLEHPDHQNKGMSASRNFGLQHSRGKYIARLDADDLYVPETLEEQVAIMEAYPAAAMVYGPALYWCSWAAAPGEAIRDPQQAFSFPPDTLIEPPTLLARFLRYPDNEPYAMLVRREVMEDVGGYESALSMYEDVALSSKVCLKYPVYASSRCWGKYRMHPQSYCSVAKADGTYDAGRGQFLKWLAGYLSSQQVKSKMVWQALNEQLWQYRHPRLYRLLGIQHPRIWTKETVKSAARKVLPKGARRLLREQRLNYLKQIGW